MHRFPSEASVSKGTHEQLGKTFDFDCMVTL